ncbi:oxygen-insensitive NADPH nitroreductase [Klebsiella pneumoniae]|nr:oxygen-insensitive NADPH nitroreductase [Klebsiella pneumoniae]
MTPTIELLRSHRSIRHFTDAPVSDEQRASGIYLEFFTVHLHHPYY